MLAEFFNRDLLWFKVISVAYVAAIPLSHGALPAGAVWPLAWGFMILMLIPYSAAAWRGPHQGTEAAVAVILAGLATAGLIASPWLIIAAIALHGTWDIAKLNGVGMPFFCWYVTGCVAVDWIYASVLTAYLIWSLPL